MHCYTLPLAETSAFSTAFLDFLAGKPALRSFYEHSPNLANFEYQLPLKKAFAQGHRQVLHNALREQYGAKLRPAVAAQLDSLLAANTFTVTTGHQLCLATGPLYFIYKIITTLNTAQALQKAYPQHHFVPVYWMATEDHDFAEINHFHLFGKTFTWETSAQGAVGRLKLDDLANLWPLLPQEAQWMAEIYQQADNLAEATRTLVDHLFGEQGVVCVDGDHPALKKLFVPVLEKELFEGFSYPLVQQDTAALNQLGYAMPVQPREINLFYLEDALRERLVQDGEVYKVLHTDKQFTRAEMQAMLHQHPERFSPNVVLRPLYQEIILPNLAYVGGPSELLYWLQLKSCFDSLQVPFPILLPRNFATIITAANQKKINKFQLQTNDLFLEEEALKKKFLAIVQGPAPELTAEENAIAQAWESVKQKFQQLDPSLVGWVAAEQQKTQKTWVDVGKRLQKVFEKKSETDLQQLAALKQKLFPQQGLQERYDNFLNFALNKPDFLAELQQTFDPFCFEMYIIEGY
ncbi:MAG TPA: bacillithiol biosynthesis cysteine-adding enzyme BshC [Microscillaceae bacterium]|jgi:bacillithiol biosynthesis cysteine-adding enzyme BshC|nr:bacillithiol biosynthesis cysteine-adding enzyme BshC [Microscillaceae bacterium]